MLKLPTNVVLIPLLVLLCSSRVVAACGSGTPSYNDIEAVRYARTSCFGTCPNYEVLFGGTSLWYVGRSEVPKHGTYEATRSLPLGEAIRVLKQHKFFTLNYDPSLIVTDVPHDIISVQRCGVTTILDWRDDGSEPAIEAILDAFDKITAKVHWHKTGRGVCSPESSMASNSESRESC